MITYFFSKTYKTTMNFFCMIPFFIFRPSRKRPAAPADDPIAYRIFSVTSVMAASSSEMIQNRVTIFVSKMPRFW